MPLDARTPFAPTAQVYPFNRRNPDPQPAHREQVAVTYRGETVVYATPEALRQAVLERHRTLAARVTLGPASNLAADLRQARLERRGQAARAGFAIAAMAGALAGFALYGLDELHKAGWL